MTARRAEPHPPRLFGTDHEVRRIVAGLLDRTLPRRDWTHEAHLAAITGLLLEQPGFVAERDLPATIAGYNAAVGGVNDDSQGYHETITQFWIQVARRFHRGTHGALVTRANALIAAEPEGTRGYPLRFWSHATLFSVEARRRWVEPDRMRFGDDEIARPRA